MPILTGKVALITGASKGIGAAIAERLAAEGAAVAVNYARSEKEAQQVVARIQKAGGKAIAIQGDVSKSADAQALVQRTVAEFGRLDIVVNNAGIYDFKPLTEITEEHYDSLFNTNVKGLLFTTKEAVKAFNGGGRIINISSKVSTSPMANASVYSGTKAAIDAFTKSLASELGPRKILVNSVLPGPVATEGFEAMPGSDQFREFAIPLTALGRMGTPDDISGVVAFLASDASGWVTGQLIEATGGLRL